MGIVFNSSEVLEMALQIERNGAAFYHAAAKAVADKKAAQVLETLASMEKKHEETFAAMKGILANASQEEVFDYNTEEARMYLHAMADGQVFDTRADPVRIIGEGVSTLDVMLHALKMEKDSIVFYHGMKKLVPRSLGLEDIDRIIDEELDHIVIISKEISKLH